MTIAAPRKEGRMEARPQPTALRAAHLALGGCMVAFAGFELQCTTAASSRSVSPVRGKPLYKGTSTA
jgi:hypothetical protein